MSIYKCLFSKLVKTAVALLVALAFCCISLQGAYAKGGKPLSSEAKEIVDKCWNTMIDNYGPAGGIFFAIFICSANASGLQCLEYEGTDIAKVQADQLGDKIKKCIAKDIDKDSSPDYLDNCLNTSNPDQKDTDGDYAGDLCDDDIDNDGLKNEDDNCPNVANPDQADQDSDGYGDVCDTTDDTEGDDGSGKETGEDPKTDPKKDDSTTPPSTKDTDNDGVEDSKDNCSAVANQNQSDKDNDGFGDVCDKCPNIYDTTNNSAVCINSALGVPHNAGKGGGSCSLSGGAPVNTFGYLFSLMGIVLIWVQSKRRGRK